MLFYDGYKMIVKQDVVVTPTKSQPTMSNTHAHATDYLLSVAKSGINTSRPNAWGPNSAIAPFDPLHQ